MQTTPDNNLHAAGSLDELHFFFLLFFFFFFLFSFFGFSFFSFFGLNELVNLSIKNLSRIQKLFSVFYLFRTTKGKQGKIIIIIITTTTNIIVIIIIRILINPKERLIHLNNLTIPLSPQESPQTKIFDVFSFFLFPLLFFHCCFRCEKNLWHRSGRYLQRLSHTISMIKRVKNKNKTKN